MNCSRAVRFVRRCAPAQPPHLPVREPPCSRRSARRVRWRWGAWEGAAVTATVACLGARDAPRGDPWRTAYSSPPANRAPAAVAERGGTVACVFAVVLPIELAGPLGAGRPVFLVAPKRADRTRSVNLGPSEPPQSIPRSKVVSRGTPRVPPGRALSAPTPAQQRCGHPQVPTAAQRPAAILAGVTPARTGHASSGLAKRPRLDVLHYPSLVERRRRCS